MQPAICVEINLAVVRANIARIAAAAKVPVIAVIKADAYGLGVTPVIRAIDDLVDSYYVFEPREIVDAATHTLTSKTFIAAVCGDATADELLAHRIRPAVWTIDQARRWQACDCVLAVDTGQQRFAAGPDQLDAIIAAGVCREAFTHASNITQAGRFDELTRGRSLRRHAAGTSLLDAPAARFDAVRPGFAMYAGAVRVTTRLLDARASLGPAGYTGFQTPYHGVMLGGYSEGLAAGACIINGVKRRLLEVGMQSSFVELGPADRAGDAITLLGDGLTEADVANAWRCGTHEALFRMARCGSQIHL